ncbi:MAG: hypothetical protein ACSLFI_13180 [Solirubrobacterales bacterium]
MATEKPRKNRDGTSIETNEYIGLVLAVIVPIVGLLFGVYLRSEGNRFGDRIILVSLIALVVWTAMILFI